LMNCSTWTSFVCEEMWKVFQSWGMQTSRARGRQRLIFGT
jgi:hypothetical protein